MAISINATPAGTPEVKARCHFNITVSGQTGCLNQAGLAIDQSTPTKRKHSQSQQTLNPIQKTDTVAQLRNSNITQKYFQNGLAHVRKAQVKATNEPQAWV